MAPSRKKPETLAPLPRVSPFWKAAGLLRRAAGSRALAVVVSLLAAALYVRALSTDESVRAFAYERYCRLGATLGLTVKNFYLEGAVHTDKEEVAAIVADYKGMPMFSVPIDDVKAQLEALPWSDAVLVERLFPSTVAVRLREHRPVAIWQHDGAFYLVNAYGETITSVADYKPYGELILISGAKAVDYMKELMRMLSLYPDVAAQVASASFVGERRWDVYLRSGVLLRFPEENPEAAMEHVRDMAKAGVLDGVRIKTVDLKEARRIYIEPEAEPAANVAAGFKTDGKGGSGSLKR
jgi:cell division protein FtsQ